MNLLEFNHIHINRFNKSMLFPEFDKEEDFRFLYANQVEGFLKYDAHVFPMLTSLKVENGVVSVDLSMVCEF